MAMAATELERGRPYPQIHRSSGTGGGAQIHSRFNPHTGPQREAPAQLRRLPPPLTAVTRWCRHHAGSRLASAARGGHAARGTSGDGVRDGWCSYGRHQLGVVAGARRLLRPHDAKGGLGLLVVVDVDRRKAATVVALPTDPHVHVQQRRTPNAAAASPVVS
jgi:hypothetical protein